MVAYKRGDDSVFASPPDERRAYRRAHAKPLLGQLHTWLSEMLATLSRKSDTSRAILYALNRWEALTRYCDDGRLEIDNLPVDCWVVFAYRYRARRPADEDA